MGKGYMVFLIPGVYAIVEGIFTPVSLDVVAVVVSFSAAIVGSSLQLSEKQMIKQLTKAEIVYVYIAGTVIAILSHGVWYWKENFWYLGVTAVIFSYMSLDILPAIRKAILKIVAFLPDIFRTYLLSKLNTPNEKKDNNDNDAID